MFEDLNHDEAYYEAKYKKYKAKYLKLKEEYDSQGGALLAKTGIAAVISSNDRIDKIKKSFELGKAPTRFTMDENNDREAYIVYDGEDYMTLMQSSSRQLSDKTKQAYAAASSKAKELGSIAYEKGSKIASEVGQKASELAIQAGQKASELASRAGQKTLEMVEATKLKLKRGGGEMSLVKINLGVKFNRRLKEHHQLVKKLVMEQGVSAEGMLIIAFNKFGSNQLIDYIDLTSL